MYRKLSLPILSMLLACINLNLRASNQSSDNPNDKVAINIDSIQKITVFSSGDDGIDSYRIPSLVTSKKGTLLLFTEARKESSTDKTPTDIALKRSEDNGKSWSNIHILTQSGKDAYMDPVAVVDKFTGKIFLFTSLGHLTTIVLLATLPGC